MIEMGEQLREDKVENLIDKNTQLGELGKGQKVSHTPKCRYKSSKSYHYP